MATCRGAGRPASVLWGLPGHCAKGGSHGIFGEERSLAADDEGYLLEPDYSDLVCEAIAAAERVSLDEDHGTLLNYLHDQYCEQDHTPNFPTQLKDVSDQTSNCVSKRLYDLFALGPAKQGARIAGLPKPFGKGAY